MNHQKQPARFDRAKVSAVLKAAHALDLAMVDCWGRDDDPEQSWDAPARIVKRLRAALDALAPDAGLVNEKRRAHAVAKRTQEIRREAERELRLAQRRKDPIAHALAIAPVAALPTSDEERRVVEEGRAAIAQGKVVTQKRVEARLAERRRRQKGA